MPHTSHKEPNSASSNTGHSAFPISPSSLDNTHNNDDDNKNNNVHGINDTGTSNTAQFYTDKLFPPKSFDSTLKSICHARLNPQTIDSLPTFDSLANSRNPFLKPRMEQLRQQAERERAGLGSPVSPLSMKQPNSAYSGGIAGITGVEGMANNRASDSENKFDADGGLASGAQLFEGFRSATMGQSAFANEMFLSHPCPPGDDMSSASRSPFPSVIHQHPLTPTVSAPNNSSGPNIQKSKDIEAKNHSEDGSKNEEYKNDANVSQKNHKRKASNRHGKGSIDQKTVSNQDLKSKKHSKNISPQKTPSTKRPNHPKLEPELAQKLDSKLSEQNEVIKCDEDCKIETGGLLETQNTSNVESTARIRIPTPPAEVALLHQDSYPFPNSSSSHNNNNRTNNSNSNKASDKLNKKKSISISKKNLGRKVSMRHPAGSVYSARSNSTKAGPNGLKRAKSKVEHCENKSELFVRGEEQYRVVDNDPSMPNLIDIESVEKEKDEGAFGKLVPLGSDTPECKEKVEAQDASKLPAEPSKNEHSADYLKKQMVEGGIASQLMHIYEQSKTKDDKDLEPVAKANLEEEWEEVGGNGYQDNNHATTENNKLEFPSVPSLRDDFTHEIDWYKVYTHYSQVNGSSSATSQLSLYKKRYLENTSFLLLQVQKLRNKNDNLSPKSKMEMLMTDGRRVSLDLKQENEELQNTNSTVCNTTFDSELPKNNCPFSFSISQHPVKLWEDERLNQLLWFAKWAVDIVFYSGIKCHLGNWSKKLLKKSLEARAQCIGKSQTRVQGSTDKRVVQKMAYLARKQTEKNRAFFKSKPGGYDDLTSFANKGLENSIQPLAVHNEETGPKALGCDGLPFYLPADAFSEASRRNASLDVRTQESVWQLNLQLDEYRALVMAQQAIFEQHPDLSQEFLKMRMELEEAEFFKQNDSVNNPTKSEELTSMGKLAGPTDNTINAFAESGNFWRSTMPLTTGSILAKADKARMRNVLSIDFGITFALAEDIKKAVIWTSKPGDTKKRPSLHKSIFKRFAKPATESKDVVSSCCNANCLGECLDHSTMINTKQEDSAMDQSEIDIGKSKNCTEISGMSQELYVVNSNGCAIACPKCKGPMKFKTVMTDLSGESFRCTGFCNSCGYNSAANPNTEDKDNSMKSDKKTDVESGSKVKRFFKKLGFKKRHCNKEAQPLVSFERVGFTDTKSKSTETPEKPAGSPPLDRMSGPTLCDGVMPSGVSDSFDKSSAELANYSSAGLVENRNLMNFGLEVGNNFGGQRECEPEGTKQIENSIKSADSYAMDFIKKSVEASASAGSHFVVYTAMAGPGGDVHDSLSPAVKSVKSLIQNPQAEQVTTTSIYSQGGQNSASSYGTSNDDYQKSLNSFNMTFSQTGKGADLNMNAFNQHMKAHEQSLALASNHTKPKPNYDGIVDESSAFDKIASISSRSNEGTKLYLHKQYATSRGLLSQADIDSVDPSFFISLSNKNKNIRPNSSSSSRPTSRHSSTSSLSNNVQHQNPDIIDKLKNLSAGVRKFSQRSGSAGQKLRPVMESPLERPYASQKLSSPGHSTQNQTQESFVPTSMSNMDSGKKEEDEKITVAHSKLSKLETRDDDSKNDDDSIRELDCTGETSVYSGEDGKMR